MELTEPELLEGWKEQNVFKVKRIKIRHDDKEVPTKHLILTFDRSSLFRVPKIQSWLPVVLRSAHLC